MNKLFLFCAALLMISSSIFAATPIDLKRLTSGEFAAKTVSGIDPIPGTDQYARISADGKQIVQCSFKTGKQTAVLFDYFVAVLICPFPHPLQELFPP